jgi:hypothetical protein
LGVNEAMGAPYLDLVLLRFQNLLDSWQAERLTLFNFTRVTSTLPSGTSTRTIGPTGQIVTTANPVFITAINYVVPGTSPAVETPMGQMDEDAYANLPIKDLSSSLPTEWFFNRGATTGTLTFWPVVDQAVEIAIYVNFGVGVPATINDTVVGPPGYPEAFMYQLALRLCTPFGRPMPPNLPQMAAEALRRIKRPNTSPGLLGVDPALVPISGGAYNILNDQTSAPSNR